MLTGLCDSCGDAADTLVGVHRIYLVPTTAPADGGERRAEVMTEIEQWCFPCRTHYPHQVLDVEE